MDRFLPLYTGYMTNLARRILALKTFSFLHDSKILPMPLKIFVFFHLYCSHESVRPKKFNHLHITKKTNTAICTQFVPLKLHY